MAKAVESVLSSISPSSTMDELPSCAPKGGTSSPTAMDSKLPTIISTPPHMCESDRTRSPMKFVESDRTGPMKFVGHRGASQVLPEQTMAAVKDALERGLSFECDLQVTRESDVVLLHDSTLERTAAKWDTETNATGLDEAQYAQLVRAPASTLSYDELSRVDIGSWFDAAHSEERVPLFSQALQALKETGGGDACCFAELKSQDEETGGTGPMPELDRQLVDAAVIVAGGEAPAFVV